MQHLRSGQELRQNDKERNDHHALPITLAAGAGSFVTIEGGFPISSEGEIVGVVGVSGAELLLLRHTETVWELIPLPLIGLVIGRGGLAWDLPFGAACHSAD